jgi:hypothetical protein
MKDNLKMILSLAQRTHALIDRNYLKMDLASNAQSIKDKRMMAKHVGLTLVLLIKSY